jgi:GntR family transcriptional regulator
VASGVSSRSSPLSSYQQGRGPLYSRLEEIIRERIDTGEWLPGTLIPSERELSATFALSRTTTRRALERLERDGLLRKEPRRGTFVAEPKATFEALSLRGFSAQALESGASPASRLLHFERVVPSPSVSGALEIGADQLVYLIERLRMVNDVPVALHKSYLAVDLAPDLRREDLGERSLYDVLEAQYGIKVANAQETLQSTSATEYEASVLGIPPGAPMLLLNIVLRSGQGRPVELVRAVFRGDRIRLRYEI